MASNGGRKINQSAPVGAMDAQGGERVRREEHVEIEERDRTDQLGVCEKDGQEEERALAGCGREGTSRKGEMAQAGE